MRPGETFNRDTGSVWFTVKANIQADGKEPRSDWDCVKPVAAIVGTIIIGAATAGVAAFVALPAGATILAGGSAAGAMAAIATPSALVVAGAAAGGAAGGASLAAAGKLTAQELGARLEPNSEATIRGQYAGPDWPFRCDRSRHITLQMAGVEPAKMPMAIWSLTQARHFVLPRRTTAATV